jgi:hypothetical protein
VTRDTVTYHDVPPALLDLAAWACAACLAGAEVIVAATIDDATEQQGACLEHLPAALAGLPADAQSVHVCRPTPPGPPVRARLARYAAASYPGRWGR